MMARQRKKQMAQYKHHPDTLIVLRDIENRLEQLIEASQTSSAPFVETETQALQSAKMLVVQARKTGHVFRGSSAVPDGLLPYVKTPSVTEQLGVNHG